MYDERTDSHLKDSPRFMEIVGLCKGNYNIGKEFFQLGHDNEEIERRLGSVRHLPQSFQEMELLGKSGTSSTKKEMVCSFSKNSANKTTITKPSPANPVTPESRFESEFKSNPKLQVEFGADGLADYIVYRRAEEAGRVRIFKGDKVTSATAEDAKAEQHREEEFAEKLSDTKALQYENEFLKSPELQAEFGGADGLKDYIALRKAEDRGEAKAIGGSVVTLEQSKK